MSVAFDYSFISGFCVHFLRWLVRLSCACFMAWRRRRCSLVIIAVWPFAILGVVGAVFDIAMQLAKLGTGRSIKMFVYLRRMFLCGPAIIVALLLFTCSIVHAALLIVMRSVRNGIGWHTKRHVGRYVGDGWCAAFCCVRRFTPQERGNLRYGHNA